MNDATLTTIVNKDSLLHDRDPEVNFPENLEHIEFLKF